MRIVIWVLKLLPLAAVILLLHFYLPSRDVVRIVETDVKRMDAVSSDFVEEGSGASFTRTRDVRFINAYWPNNKPRVYRNEETGWGFPWYFKFESQDLQTIAQDLRSTREDPIWVVVTHYGWRIHFLSMFPNAVHIARVDSPDYVPIPWFRIFFFVFFAAAMLGLWYAWRWFIIVYWEPFMAELALDERFENASTAVGQVWRWFNANLGDRLGRQRQHPRGR